MDFEPAPDIQKRIADLVEKLGFLHVRPENIVCMRSFNSKSNAIARIWSLSRIWQKALGVEAHYIIEVLRQRFDELSREEQDKTLIHEILHIPKTFSGALVPHKCFNKRIDRKAVEKYYNMINE